MRGSRQRHKHRRDEKSAKYHSAVWNYFLLCLIATRLFAVQACPNFDFLGRYSKLDHGDKPSRFAEQTKTSVPRHFFAHRIRYLSTNQVGGGAEVEEGAPIKTATRKLSTSQLATDHFTRDD